MDAQRAARDLAVALERESDHIEALGEVIARQREAVRTGDMARIDSAAHDIQRTLLALGEARDLRRAVLASHCGDADLSLAELERRWGSPLPPPLSQARLRQRRAADRTAHETRVHREVLRRSIAAGEAFLQALFSAAGEPPPGYAVGDRLPARVSARLLDRRA